MDKRTKNNLYMYRVSVFITTYSSIETFASIELIFGFNRMNTRSKQPSIELTRYQISNEIDRLDPTDQKDKVRTESQLRVALILSERDNEFVIAILTVFKQVLNFANHRTKESFVSTANKPLVGTLITIGGVTVSIAIFPFEFDTVEDKQVGGYSSRGHFMNSVFVNPVFIHVLLMLLWKSLRICFFHIYQIYVLGMSLQTCFSMMFAHIVSLRGPSREDSSLLREIREPVWSYIIDLCSWFVSSLTLLSKTLLRSN